MKPFDMFGVISFQRLGNARFQLEFPGVTGELLYHHNEPFGRFEARLTRTDVGDLHFMSQPVRLEVTPGGIALLHVRIIDSIAITLNTQSLAAQYEGDDAEPPLVIQFKPQEPIDEVLSFEHPEATAMCQAYMNERSARLAQWNEVRDGRIERPEQDAYEDLLKSLLALQDLVTLVKQGRDFHRLSIRAHLRALIAWGNYQRSYTPLLLRVAAMANAPLPVYMAKVERPPIDPAKSIVLQDTYNLSLVRLSQKHEIVDLQEWMESVAQTEFLDDGATERSVTQHRAILETANQIGGSHYDAGVTPEVNALRSIMPQFLESLEVLITETIIPLGMWVLSQVGYIEFKAAIGAVEPFAEGTSDQ